jgi:hypothetical protein
MDETLTTEGSFNSSFTGSEREEGISEYGELTCNIDVLLPCVAAVAALLHPPLMAVMPFFDEWRRKRRQRKLEKGREWK